MLPKKELITSFLSKHNYNIVLTTTSYATFFFRIPVDPNECEEQNQVNSVHLQTIRFENEMK